MAGIDIGSSKMSFLLVSGLVMLLSIVVAAEDVVPLAPLPAPDHNYLEQCGTKLRPKCGEEIREAVFVNGAISEGCCKDLLVEGRACHDKFVQVTAPYYSEPARSGAPTKSAQVWNDCVAIAPKN